MKDYATESDIITTADPLFYPGDRVEQSDHKGYTLTVEGASWNSLKNSWTYVLLYFLSGKNQDIRWDGSLAVEEAFEKDVKLVLRSRK